MHISWNKDDESVEVESVTKPVIEEARKAIHALNNLAFLQNFGKATIKLLKEIIYKKALIFDFISKK